MRMGRIRRWLRGTFRADRFEADEVDADSVNTESATVTNEVDAGSVSIESATVTNEVDAGSVNTEVLGGDLVDRVEDINHLEGNIYLTEEGAPDPTENDGDLWFEYESE